MFEWLHGDAPFLGAGVTVSPPNGLSYAGRAGGGDIIPESMPQADGPEPVEALRPEVRKAPKTRTAQEVDAHATVCVVIY